METKLLKFIERVRDVDNGIASEYTRIKNQTGSVRQQYGLTTTAGELKENVKKNRYKDILPYDQTRVLLSPTPEYTSDYINANFIKGATGSIRYIATQGPLSNTVVDLWRMIWEYDIRVIIMACKEIELGKKKCEVYWPPQEHASTFGPYSVSTVEESHENEEVLVRALSVKHCDEVRTLSHFQYTAWPDHGIPDVSDNILGMLESVHVKQGYHPGPVLIHCSAGCGRTGVICAIDIVNDLLQKKNIGEDFSIMDIVLELRKQRTSFVQTKEQYEFVFHTVAQMFEKVLQMSPHNHQHQNQVRHSQTLYANALSLKPALRSYSVSCENKKERKPPAFRPKSSHPSQFAKMNDTYAVVNKFKQPSSVPPVVPSHYVNENHNRPRTPANDLYSTVKPKNRPLTNTPASTVPVYDNRQPAKMDFDGYESVPVEFQMRDSQRLPGLPQGHSNRNSHSDDDYEYVSNPIRESSSSIHCNLGSMGFKCRVRKPKGPRDPPSQWNRPER